MERHLNLDCAPWHTAKSTKEGVPKMAYQITPKGNILVSGPLTLHEEQLLNETLNATPKTVAYPASRRLPKSPQVKQKVKRPS